MDLRELENFRLEDAVKFHDHLNPRIWGSDEQMLPAVREKLLAIADDFRESLGIDLEVKDITISGSNAAYTYTPHSDIDLHLVTDLPEADASEVYRELFDAKKYQYNDEHDYTIGGAPVELYVQDASKPHYSQGIYSIKDDRWLSVPKRRKPEINDISVRSKYEDIGARVDAAIESGDLARMDRMAHKIRTMRQAGLEKTGEFGPENLAFKVLRNNGTLDRLKQARLAAKDREMSLAERKKSKRKKKFKYGAFGGYYFPGYGYYGSGEGSDGGDGGGEGEMEDYDPNAEPPGPESKPEMPPGTVLVNVSDVYDWYKLGQDISDLEHANPAAYGKGAPQTVLSFGSEPIEHMYKKNLDRLGMKTLDIDRKAKVKDPEGAYRMDEDQHTEKLLKNFVDFTAGRLGIEKLPRIRFKKDPAWSEQQNTFGRYVPEENTLYVSLPGRHPLDIMRTIAHELTHHLQNERESVPDHAGETGSDWENEANARAGIIMRQFADLHPEMFRADQAIDESLRGRLGAAAAVACIAGTPGCATTDISAADALRGAQAIGRAAQATKPYGTASRSDVIRAGAEEELKQELKNILRRGTGTGDRSGVREADEPVYKLDDPIVNYDIPYSAIARPERLQQARRFGRISHYASPGASSAIISIPVSREQPFLATMKNMSIPVVKSRMYEASGYIPTAKEKDDPRYKMALTVDVHPGQTGREANKLNLKTDSQGRPQLLMKRLANLLESVKSGEDLFEVKMSPGELEKWAKSPEAEGIQAGFEAELIFRDTARDDGDEREYEPDYEQDERAHSIDQVVEFFQGGDNGISSRTARNLSTALQEEYYEWRDEAIYDEWSNVAEEQVEDYMETNVWGDDNTQDQYREQAAERLGIETSEESAERADEIEQLAREIFKEDIQDQIENEGNYYDDAREYFRDMAADSGDYDEDAFLSDRYRYMTDIADAHGIDWPYWTGGGSNNGGGREPQGIADSLKSTLDSAGIDNTGVMAGTGYHGVARKPGRWIIEPDGSLDPDDYEDAGLEVVSPPMPLPEAMRALRTVIDWANSSEGDAYTNSSTGLHMGVSIPHKGGAVDYVKLVLFMGDQHVLDQFDRAANTYCASALEKLRQTQTARRRGVREQDMRSMTGAEKTAAAMDLMRKNLVELAQRYVQDGVGQSKYTSAHIKDGYIEFRSPGGDYLSMDSRDEQALGNTMLRFARAMYLAGRPDLERREYSKKLYKLLSGFRSAETAKDTKRDTKYRTHIETEGANDALELFAKYSSGMINSEELKKQWAEQVLAKEQPAKPQTQDWEVVDAEGNVKGMVQADDREKAVRAMSTQFDDWLYLDVRPKQADAEPEPEKKLSRRAQVAKRIKERPSIWRVTDTNTNRSITVAADGTQDAKYQARLQDPDFQKLFYNDPDSMLVEPASAEEVKQYRVQQADNKKDSEQVQQRVQGRSGRYRVRWTERRGEREAQDSLTVDAANADAAMASIRHALEAQGREIISIEAAAQQQTGWQDQLRQELNQYSNLPAADVAAGEPIPGSTLDRARQRAATAQTPRNTVEIYNPRTGEVLSTAYNATAEEIQAKVEELERQHQVGAGLYRIRSVDQSAEQPRRSIYTGQWTGRWQVRNATTGEVVYTLAAGAGNNQGDANRIAQIWVRQTGYDDPVEVVPEMM